MQLALRNRYYALRHGISLANEQGIIVSHPENGLRGWGLSHRGAMECRRLLAGARGAGGRFDPVRTVVYTSDFLRAVETAAILCELHGLRPPIADPRLRERNFGRFEMKGIAAYEAVWARDSDDAEHSFEGCESTAELARRLGAFVDDVERRLEDRTIIAVSHGDPLQVLETIVRGMPCNRHRSLPHLGNAELRRLG